MKALYVFPNRRVADVDFPRHLRTADDRVVTVAGGPLYDQIMGLRPALALILTDIRDRDLQDVRAATIPTGGQIIDGREAWDYLADLCRLRRGRPS